jgi:hypothetical protein
MLTDLETAIIFVITYLVLVFAYGAVLLNIEEKNRRRRKNGEKRRICKMHRRAKLRDDVSEKV